MSSSKYAYMSYYFTKQIREEIGRKLEEVRRKKDLKQVEIAVQAGLNPSYYSKIERGSVNFSMEKFYRIIKALSAKSSDILPF